MINALGLLEVYGFVAGVEAMDAMLKSANVRLLSHAVTPSALVTVVIEGDLAACRAALDAGSAAVERLGGRVVCRKELGRPEKDTERMVLSFLNGTQADVKEVKDAIETVNNETLEEITEDIIEEAVEEIEAVEAVEDVVGTLDALSEIMSFLRQKSNKSANMTDIINHMDMDREFVKDVVHKGVAQKLLRKQSNRYYIIEGA